MNMHRIVWFKCFTFLAGAFAPLLVSRADPVAWGSNGGGRLGAGFLWLTEQYHEPVPVAMAGGLAAREFLRMEVGATHVLALADNGVLYDWGSDGSSATSRPTPEPVNLSGPLAGKTIALFSAGEFHSLVLTSDGRLYAWGVNTYGQLGDGTTTSSATPVPVNQSGVLAGKQIRAIACGNGFSVVATTEGRVYAWGRNHQGQLGDRTSVDRLAPVAVDTSGVLDGQDITALSAGTRHVMALAATGRVYGWGGGGDGELGHGGVGNYYYPWPMAVVTGGAIGDRRITAVSAGRSHTLFLAEDGTVYGCGANTNGELGTGDATVKAWSPLAVDQTGALAGKTVTAVTAGLNHSACITSEGRAYAWGSNYNGEAGRPDVEKLPAPTEVPTTGALQGQRLTAIGAGDNFTAALAAPVLPAVMPAAATLPPHVGHADATLRGWIHPGRDCTAIFFDFGPDASYGSTVQPPMPNVLGDAAAESSAVIAGLPFNSTWHYRVRAVNSLGTVLGTDQSFTTPPPVPPALAATGDNTYGQLGDATPDFRTTLDLVPESPVLAGGGMGVLGVGRYHAVTSTTDGNLAAWGHNSHFQAGYSWHSELFSPLRFPASGSLAGRTITALEGGWDFTLALDTGGLIHAWGHGQDGQSGDGLQSIRQPVPVAADLTGALAGKTVTRISAGFEHCLALTTEGRVYGWGSNANGQLGDGNTFTRALVPQAVDDTGVLAGQFLVGIAAGYVHSLALGSDGSVFGWGINFYGPLGTGGTNFFEPLPVKTELAAVASQIDAGAWHSVALSDAGEVWTWGLNDHGQIGDGTTAERPLPFKVSGLLAGRKIVAISAGDYFTVALDDQGRAFAWGDNRRGQLGDGTTTSRLEPVAVVMTGAAAGRRITAIRAGGDHFVAMTGYPPLHIADARPLPGVNRFELGFATIPGLGYRVQSSTDLVTWDPAHGFTASEALTWWTDPATPGARRFYKALQP